VWSGVNGQHCGQACLILGHQGVMGVIICFGCGLRGNKVYISVMLLSWKELGSAFEQVKVHWKQADRASAAVSGIMSTLECDRSAEDIHFW
jgi:hypothetical protein